MSRARLDRLGGRDDGRFRPGEQSAYDSGVSDLAVWDIEVPSPHVEPTPRWIRVRAEDTVVGDSRRALLLTWYGPGMLPTYCLPPEDTRTDLFQPSAAPAGAAEFLVHHDVRIGDHVFERAAQLLRDRGDPGH
jgi:hypothetical protein